LLDFDLLFSKMKRSETYFVIMVLQCCVSKHYAKSELAEYDYDEYNEVLIGQVGESEYYEEAVTSIPEFLSNSKEISVDEGESFRLPCFVTRLEEYVLMWMKNEEIISLGNQILSNVGP